MLQVTCILTLYWHYLVLEPLRWHASWVHPQFSGHVTPQDYHSSYEATILGMLIVTFCIYNYIYIYIYIYIFMHCQCMLHIMYILCDICYYTTSAKLWLSRPACGLSNDILRKKRNTNFIGQCGLICASASSSKRPSKVSLDFLRHQKVLICPTDVQKSWYPKMRWFHKHPWCQSGTKLVSYIYI